MPMKNFSISFYFVFSKLTDLEDFRDFLNSWSQGYNIVEGNLSASSIRRDLFQVYFTISRKGKENTIPSDKICELIKWVSDGTFLRDQEIRLDHVQMVASIIGQ